MTIEKIPHNGLLVISDIINGMLVVRKYSGYTVKHAKKLFREDTGGKKGGDHVTVS